MAANKFSGRVNYNIGTILNRPQEIRSGKGIVNDQGNVILMGIPAHVPDLSNINSRVANGLQVNCFSFRVDSPTEVLRFIRVYKMCCNAQLGQGYGK